MSSLDQVRNTQTFSIDEGVFNKSKDRFVMLVGRYMKVVICSSYKAQVFFYELPFLL